MKIAVSPDASRPANLAKPRDIVIVGTSMAGLRAAEGLRPGVTQAACT
jgi:hypothetical protein